MSKKVVSFVVDGVEYRVSQPGAETAGAILFRGGQVFAAALQRSAPETMDPAAIMVFVMGLVRFMTADDFTWLVKEMRELTQVGVVDKVGGKGKVTFVGFDQVPGGYDEHFAGRYDEMMTWLWRSAEACFGPFVAAQLARLAALKAAQARKAESSSSPPQEETGTSGDSSSPST